MKNLNQEFQFLKSRLELLDAKQAFTFFELTPQVKLLKSTISICPTCLIHCLAVVYVKNTKVYLKKYCLEHSYSEAIMEADENYYFLSNRDQWGQRFDASKIFDIPNANNSCCGGSKSCGPSDSVLNEHFTDQMSNKTCTILVEVTDACNLSCAVCYADAKGDRYMPLEVFKQHILSLIKNKGELDSVQVTGGEASMHPQFWDILDFLYQQESIKKIYLPSNGLLFKKTDNLQKLKKIKNKIMLLLQFDGVSENTDQFLRNAKLTQTRTEVLQELAKANISVQLTMTLALGLNENELDYLLKLGFRYKNIKVLALQPATFSGRYERNFDALHRLTLSDMVKVALKYSKVKTQEKDFVPVPCSHPNCGWLTLYLRRWGLKKNLIPHTDLKRALDTVSNKAMLTSNEIQNALQKSQKGFFKELFTLIGKRFVRSEDILTVAIKPFMDRFNYDQDRISSCCHHLMDTQGNPVSFCEYNALLRPQDSWKKFPLKEELIL